MTYVGATPTTGDFKLLDSITTSSTTTFNLRQGGVAVYPQSANHCLVVLNGVLQTAGSSFNIVNDTIVFASSLSSSDVINQILVLGNVNDIGVPSDDTVSTAKIQTDAVNATKIADDSISDEHLDITAITGQTAITSLADTDKFLVSDASDSGNLKYVENQYLGGGAIELLSSATRTSGSVGQVYMTDFMDNTKYISYIAHCSFKNAGNGNNQFFNFTSSGGTTMEATNYYGAGNAIKNANGTVSNNTREIATNENKVSWVAAASTRTAFMEFVMHPIGVTTDSGVSNVFFRGQIDRWNGSSREPQYVTGAAYYINSTVPTGFVIGASGGNWERYEIRVYGVKKA